MATATATSNPHILEVEQIDLLLPGGRIVPADLMAILPSGEYLLGFYTHKDERHNYGGKLGGQSSSPLINANGKPIELYVIRLGKLCPKHELTFLVRYGDQCPKCASEAQ